MPRLDIQTRRTQLIEAAVRIAVRDGLDNTTIRRVAAEAGVSLGTVHYCFEGKSALLEAVVDHLFEREFSAEAFTFDSSMDLEDAIVAGFLAYWADSGNDRDYQRLVYELVTFLVRQDEPGPQLARRVFKNNYAMAESFITGFEETFGRRVTTDREVLAHMVVAVTDGVAIAWLADEDVDKALGVLKAFAAVLVNSTEELPARGQQPEPGAPSTSDRPSQG